MNKQDYNFVRSLKERLSLYLNKSKELNGEKYDYSLVEYINSHTEVKILCNKLCNFIIRNL